MTNVAETSATPAELEAQGFTRCFVADEPRLSEAVETYVELGYEVRLCPAPLGEGACSECLARDPRVRLIYVRRRPAEQP